uniref:EGF-like domain-containing protein n=1 Tax=Ciona savignyi TaxID=51511 RepID=H2Y8K0_CIOSA
WMCGDDKCIEQNRVCDGSPDCADQSDESSDIDCPRTGSLVGGFGMFKCTDGKCIPMNWKCDSELDCDDGSDENCNETCPLGHFQCETSHKCIPLSYHCDADKDCFDGSDEVNCSSNCREDFFSCADNGHCIPNTWVCDGEVECTDGSDELSCGKFKSGNTDKFRCGDGGCISAEWKCDREFDCEDHTDEHGCAILWDCKHGYLECKSGNECYSPEWRCDGDSDCTDGTDETGCPPAPTTGCRVGQVICGDGRCMGISLYCVLPKFKDASIYKECKYMPCFHTGSCISIDRACNNVSDCLDGSDEKNCFVNECENKQSNRCQQICVEPVIFYACTCKPGYEINGDGYSCSQSNECARAAPVCAQVCEVLEGGHECRCAPSYHRDPTNRRNCKAGSHTGKPYLLYSTRYHFRESLLNGSGNHLRLVNLTDARVLDFDWPGQKIYWADRTNEGSSSVETVHKSLNHVEGLAVDWLGRNLYWTDEGEKTIKVSKLDGSFQKILVKFGLDKPRAIALLPDKGYMYWTDLGKDPHIGRVGMDGKDRSVIIHNTLLGWPNALTIDYASRKLFWADSKEDYIAHCELDGSNAIIVWQTSAAESSAISAISVFEDKLIWSELHKGSIMTSYTFASIHNGTFPHKAKQLQHSQITDLKIVHPLRQPMPMNPHPCSVDNGGCSDLCLLAPSGERSCACPEGFILDTHGLTC